MAKKLALAFALAITTTGLVAMAPPAAAHSDGCVISHHQDPIFIHQACTSSPTTCSSNVAVTGDNQAHILCQEPDNHPCLLKARAEGRHVRVCE